VIEINEVITGKGKEMRSTLKKGVDVYVVDFNKPIKKDATGTFYVALRNGETPCVVKHFSQMPDKSYEFPEEVIRTKDGVYYRFYESLEVAQTSVHLNKDYQIIGNGAGVHYAYRRNKKAEGQGGFGCVYAGYHIGSRTGQLGKKFAIKVLQNNQTSEEEVDAEVYYLRRNNFHAEWFQHENKIYVVMDYAAGTQLNVGRFVEDIDSSFDEAVSAIAQLAQRLLHLHDDGTAHLDFKPPNIRLHAENKKVRNIELVDLGLARKLGVGSKEFVQVGGFTPKYAAPEVMEKKVGGFASDIYSFGCVSEEIFVALQNNIPMALRSVVADFHRRMRMDDSAKRPLAAQVSKFFMVLHRYGKHSRAARSEDFETLECLANPEVFLKRKRLPKFPENQLELFLFAAEHERYNKKLFELARVILDEGGEEQKRVVLATVTQFSNSKDVGEQVKAFAYLSKKANYGGGNNTVLWEQLANKISNKIDACTVEQAQIFFHNLDKRTNEDNAKKNEGRRTLAVRKLGEGTAENKLAMFVYLSKSRNYAMAGNADKWLNLANDILNNRDTFQEEEQGKKLLTFLRKFNKHKKQIPKNNDAAITQVKTLVAKVLIDEVLKEEPWKITHAINGSFTFFNDWRAKRILKDAIKTQKDERVVGIVRRIKVARAV
jgi:hypothetical protein